MTEAEQTDPETSDGEQTDPKTSDGEQTDPETSDGEQTDPETSDGETGRVRTEVRDHVLIVTMTRHDKRNAIDGAMTQALDAALNRLEDDPDLWVAVLTGGTDFFCAGTDMAATSGPPTERGGVYGVVGRRRNKPLIAAVEGLRLRGRVRGGDGL